MAQTKEQKMEKALATQKRARQRAIDKANSPEQRSKVMAKAVASQDKAKAKQQTPEYKAKKESKIIKRRAIAPPKPRKAIKSKGLMGKSRNPNEKALHDKIAAIGCIACINAGLASVGDGSHVSIHHCNGRVKPEAHEEVLSLCQWHHDTPMEKKQQALNANVFPIHAKGIEGGKGLWEKENGTQEKLIVQLWRVVGYMPVFSQLLNTNK